MSTSGEWYSYDKGRPFKCGDCGKDVVEDGKRWWNKNNKTTICNDCFLKKTPPQQNVTSPRKENVPQQPPTKCDVCGDVIGGTEFHHIAKGSKWFTVCRYCYQTVRRARALKVAGLWPFEKKKDLGEEYDLTPEKGG